MTKKDALGVEIQVGDIVVVGSNSNVRICRVYGFGRYGQPLSEVLVGSGKKGDMGTAYIIIKRGNQTLSELEAIISVK